MGGGGRACAFARQSVLKRGYVVNTLSSQVSPPASRYCNASSMRTLVLVTGVTSACTSCLHRKGLLLEPSEQYVFSVQEGGRSTLTIRNIRQADGGVYTCKASNKAGAQEKELFLKVFGKLSYVTPLIAPVAENGCHNPQCCVICGMLVSENDSSIFSHPLSVTFSSYLLYIY